MKRKISRLFVLTFICTFIFSMLTVFAATEDKILGPEANNTPFQCANPAGDSKVYGLKFSFTGKEMTQLSVASMPTWGPRQSGEAEDNHCKISVYKWKTDYNTTIAQTPIKAVEENNHVDGQPVAIVFDSPLQAGTYLWVCTDATAAVGGLGFWGGAPVDGQDTVAFVDGTEDSAFIARTKITLQDSTSTPSPSTGDESAIFAILVLVTLAAGIVVKGKVTA